MPGRPHVQVGCEGLGRCGEAVERMAASDDVTGGSQAGGH